MIYVGDKLSKEKKGKVSVYADLKNGSISNSLFYGDVEVFRVSKGGRRVRRHVNALIGKGDMQILLSREYAAICSLMEENPSATIEELRKIADETDESKEIVKKILRKLSHSQDEVIRTYAFNEL